MNKIKGVVRFDIDPNEKKKRKRSGGPSNKQARKRARELVYPELPGGEYLY